MPIKPHPTCETTPGKLGDSSAELARVHRTRPVRTGKASIHYAVALPIAIRMRVAIAISTPNDGFEFLPETVQPPDLFVDAVRIRSWTIPSANLRAIKINQL